MKCSERVKRAGFKSLAQFAKVAEVPVTTLRDWHTKKPRLFEIVLMGALSQPWKTTIKEDSNEELHDKG